MENVCVSVYEKERQRYDIEMKREAEAWILGGWGDIRGRYIEKIEGSVFEV